MHAAELLGLHVQALFRFDELGRMVASNTTTFEAAPRVYIGRCEGSVAGLIRHDLPPLIAADILEMASAEPPHAGPRTPPRFAGEYMEALEQDAPVSRNYFGPAYWLPPEVKLPPVEARQLTVEDMPSLALHFPWLLAEIEAGAPVVGALQSGVVVAECYCSRVTDRVAEAGLEVVEAFRGQGLAKACTIAWAQAVRERGLIPCYGTTWENEASQAVAAAVGFEQYATDWHLG